jgi:O-antigen/teichoic acid export membrane protein
MGLMAEAGVYSLVSRIFTTPRKFIPQILNMVMPKLIVSRDRDPELFRRKYVLLSWGQFGIHAALATALLAALPLFQMLAGVPRSPVVLFLFGAFSFNLMLHALVTSNSNLILLSHDTRWVLLTSGLRAAVVSALNLTLIPLWHASGAAAAFLVSSLVVLGMYFYENRRSGILGAGTNGGQFATALGVAGVWALAAKAVGAW